jgi:putative flippase GtrA
MQPTISGTGGRPRRRGWQALGFGLPLALLDFGLYNFSITHPASLSPWTAMWISFGLALVVSFVAGFRFCYQRRHEGWESGWAGFRIGLVSGGLFLLVVLIILLVGLIMLSNAPPPSPGSREFSSPSLAQAIAIVLLLMLAFIQGISILLCAFGARIGGALAIWHAAPPMMTPEPRIE